LEELTYFWKVPKIPNSQTKDLKRLPKANLKGPLFGLDYSSISLKTILRAYSTQLVAFFSQFKKVRLDP